MIQIQNIPFHLKCVGVSLVLFSKWYSTLNLFCSRRFIHFAVTFTPQFLLSPTLDTYSVSRIGIRMFFRCLSFPSHKLIIIF